MNSNNKLFQERDVAINCPESSNISIVNIAIIQ